MYPNLEVSISSILRHVILPNNIRLLTWSAGKLSEKEIKLGYAIYKQGAPDPIFQGYFAFESVYSKADSALLEILGLVILSAWDPTMYAHDVQDQMLEYTEQQIDWLSSSEVTSVIDFLNSYEAQTLGELASPDDGEFEWVEGRLCYKKTKRCVLQDVNVN